MFLEVEIPFFIGARRRDEDDRYYWWVRGNPRGRPVNVNRLRLANADKPGCLTETFLKQMNIPLLQIRPCHEDLYYLCSEAPQGDLIVIVTKLKIKKF